MPDESSFERAALASFGATIRNLTGQVAREVRTSAAASPEDEEDLFAQ
ncbi:hypothetical protein ANO11243_067550 [Dothideomycetidae sp. 11243]|nr:hypothetical protein ANO11243_067550 [fungal sp. No.11243]